LIIIFRADSIWHHEARSKKAKRNKKQMMVVEEGGIELSRKLTLLLSFSLTLASFSTLF
jgi:hypothetical protein